MSKTADTIIYSGCIALLSYVAGQIAKYASGILSGDELSYLVTGVTFVAIWIIIYLSGQELKK